jgi:N-acetylglutamate synthase-like GNAT family acetyltransferase
LFVTRAGRHDKTDLKEFIEKETGAEVELSLGTAMIAREGVIIGCVRLIEVEPGTLVFDDVLVAKGRDRAAIAKQLVQAALNNQGGTVYAGVGETVAPLFDDFGFVSIERSEAPAGVIAYWDSRPSSAASQSYIKGR